MYVYIMTRTQIYLSEAETKALERESKTSGRSKSQLIREAIDRVFLGAGDRGSLERTLDQTAGACPRRRQTGAEHVERMRSGRLARLHHLEGE
jgi:hypothetical protein